MSQKFVRWVGWMGGGGMKATIRTLPNSVEIEIGPGNENLPNFYNYS